MATSKVRWRSDWKTSPTDGGWGVQEKVFGRAALITGRYGNAIRLHTEPLDNNVNGSGSAERCDLHGGAMISAKEGDSFWMAHSIRFPADFLPGNEWYVAAAFHNSSDDGTGQANFHVDACRWDSGVLGLRGYGEGTDWDQPDYEVKIGRIIRHSWYDFVYHMKWSSGLDGFFDAWVNGRRELGYQGPTLYAGQGVYWKLSNYHTAHGRASSIDHERVIVGSTWQSVSLTTLEGIT